MEIGKSANPLNAATMPKAPAVKTEWAERPDAPAPKADAPVDKSIGEQLNTLAGVDTRKNLYQENKKLDKEAFLKMFLEQIKYQDPTKPVDNEKVAQQMAMFSQLEQQMLTNKNLEKMISNNGNSHLMALNLMGKEVSVDRLSINHDKGSPSGFNFKLPEEAQSVKVKILDSGGEVVDELDLGARSEGNIEAKWLGSYGDGRKAESGRYFYAVEATSLKGEPINIESRVSGKVSGVSTSDGKTILHVGDQKIDLMEVSLVKEPAPEAAKSANPAPADKNAAGTKNESNVPENGTTSTKPSNTQVTLSDDVVKAIQGQAAEETAERPRIEDMGDLMNPIMPIFSR